MNTQVCDTDNSRTKQRRTFKFILQVFLLKSRQLVVVTFIAPALVVTVGL